MYYFNELTRGFFTHLIARMAEEAISLGRQAGIDYPRDYEVGFTLTEDRPGHARMMLRLGTVRHRFAATYHLRHADAFFETFKAAVVVAVLDWGRELSGGINPYLATAMPQLTRLETQLRDPRWHANALAQAKQDAATAIYRFVK